MISPTKIYRLSPHRVSMPSMVRIPAFVKTRQVNIHSPIKKQSRDRILSHNVGQSHYQEIIQFQQEQMLTTEQKISLLQSEVQLWKSRYQCQISCSARKILQFRSRYRLKQMKIFLFHFTNEYIIKFYNLYKNLTLQLYYIKHIIFNNLVEQKKSSYLIGLYVL
ncbi:hypothetical protein pb186bvf_008931 [Paramecium bursaria]